MHDYQSYSEIYSIKTNDGEDVKYEVLFEKID